MKRNPLKSLARLEGFEPPTYGLEDEARMVNPLKSLDRKNLRLQLFCRNLQPIRNRLPRFAKGGY